jgi:tripartite-type tricarboxylate transporter receptor subunit TctC
VKDFAPVMLVGTAPNAISLLPSKPWRTSDDVVKAAKAKPATITYGSVGTGSLGHLGRLRAIATTGEKRSNAMPEVQTLIEQGFPGVSALAWWGIFAPG